jgi:hypothetical protein
MASPTALIERDLGKVMDDLGAWEHVPEDRSFVRSYEPAVRAKLEYMLQHHGDHYGHQTQRLLHAWYDLLRKHANLRREANAWRAACNTITSVAWDAIPAAGTSSTATLNAPWSGVDYVLLDMLVPANTQARFRFVKLAFASIDFSQNSISSVTYSTAGGTSGTPLQQGLDATAFLHDKTAPDGTRKFTAWTGWAFAASAQIFVAVYNPDSTYPKGVDIAFLLRSSPCDQNWNPNYGMHWAREGMGQMQFGDGSVNSQWGHTVDMIHAGVLGIGAGTAFSGFSTPASMMHGGHNIRG